MDNKTDNSCEFCLFDCTFTYVHGNISLPLFTDHRLNTENSTDDRDATRTLGTRFVACGSPADTRP